MDITNDGTEMPIYTYPGSDSSSEPGPSEYDESFNKTEDHKITGAPLQESWIVGIVSSKDQIIESYQAVDELQYRSDGYISKTYDPDAWKITLLEQGKTIVMVNHFVWTGLPEYERILWMRLGY